MICTASTHDHVEFLRLLKWARSCSGLRGEIAATLEDGAGVLRLNLPEHDIRMTAFRERLKGVPGWTVWTES